MFLFCHRGGSNEKTPSFTYRSFIGKPLSFAEKFMENR